MQYRTLGKTGLLVSEIAMGCEGFTDKSQQEVTQMVDALQAGGINCIDLYTSNPQVRSCLGQALLGRREKFVLQGHLCTIWQDEQYKRTRDMEEVKEGFQDLLCRLGTDYLDIGMIHYVDALDDWEKVVQGPVFAYARSLKEAGVIRHIGLSSHNPTVARKAVESGLIEVLLFSINPCYDLMPATENVEDLFAPENYQTPRLNMDPEREALYEACQALGVGITVMKAFGGGDLLNQTLSPAGKALSLNQCLHYALTRPAVACVMAGAHSFDEIQSCLAYETVSEEEKDYASALAEFPNFSWKGHCMYCGHCAPCPQGIDVATVTKFWNLAKAQKVMPETVREHYAALAHPASDCLQCGACESRCPFGVPVIQNLQAAQKLLGR